MYKDRKFSSKFQRSAIRGSRFLWPNKRVPYSLSSRYSSYARGQIAAAIKKFESQTCMTFVPKTRSDRDYVYILPDDGCYSMVGRVGGKQELSLDNRCLDMGTVLHELMHSVGFFHEQGRHDRDDYISIHWDNIVSSAKNQFEVYSLNVILDQGIG